MTLLCEMFCSEDLRRAMVHLEERKTFGDTLTVASSEEEDEEEEEVEEEEVEEE